MPNKLLLISFLYFIKLVLGGCETANNASSETLDATIQKHFEAIQERNIEKLMETVSSEKVTLILPNGKYSSTVAAYRKVNVDWFAEKSWSAEPEIIEKILNEDTGIVLAKIHYSDLDEQKHPYSFDYFLTLVFKKQEDEWKLIFDQNTPIR